MELSNIESKINKLLNTQYKMKGISLTPRDNALVCHAIKVTAGTRYTELQLSESLLSDLSTKIIMISQNIDKARFACLALGSSIAISAEESLPHLYILDQLLENKEIQAPKEITPGAIAEYIVEDPCANIIAEIDKLNITRDIAEFIRTVQTQKAKITPPTEEPNSQPQNSRASALSSVGLFSKQTGYAVGVACVSAAAYGLYKSM